MNDDTAKRPDGPTHRDDTVSTLMNLAGPRADIPADIERRVHDNVHLQWQRATRKRIVTRWAVPAALAATVLLALSIGNRAPDVQPQVIGTIAFAVGSSDNAGTPLALGDTIQAGTRLGTGADGGISVDLSGDVSLRIAANSEVRIDQADEITLLRGQIYADSGERIYRDRHLTVNTIDGSATDVGTQFSVSYESSKMAVAVREGRVDIVHDQSSITANAGDKVVFQAGNDVIVEEVAANDPSWDWATTLAPRYDISNKSLLDFLKWAARETGRSLLFSSDAVRMNAMRTQIVGSIENLTPVEAVEAVLLTTDFAYTIDEQSITITE